MSKHLVISLLNADGKIIKTWLTPLEELPPHRNVAYPMKLAVSIEEISVPNKLASINLPPWG